VIARHLAPGETLPPAPEPLPMVELPKVEFNESAPLEQLLAEPVHASGPRPIEACGQSHGLMLYRHTMKGAQKGTLEVKEARDYALMSQQGKLLGVLDRRRKETRLDVQLTGRAPLEILVESEGHVNFGEHLVNDRKRIVGDITLNGAPLRDGRMYSLPLDNLQPLRFGEHKPTGPAFYRAKFDLKPIGDTFLDLRG
jgi:beta-galactosidase